MEEHVLMVRAVGTIRQWCSSARELLRDHQNITISGSDSLAIKVLRIAQRLERTNVARKISINVGIWRDFSQIKVLMSTTAEPESLFAERLRMDRVVFVDQEININEALLALVPDRRVMLIACDFDIIRLMFFVKFLERLNVGRKICISATTDEPKGHTRMVVVMQGIQLLSAETKKRMRAGPPAATVPPRSCKPIVASNNPDVSWAQVVQVARAQAPFLELPTLVPPPQRADKLAIRRTST